MSWNIIKYMDNNPITHMNNPKFLLPLNSKYNPNPSQTKPRCSLNPRRKIIVIKKGSHFLYDKK